MSRLKELIERLCPDGVEYTTLGKVAEIRRGVRVVKSNLATEGDIPVYQNSLTPLGYYTKSNFPADTAFVIGAGAAGEIGYSATPYWGADDCYSIICSSNIISKYVYYQLANNQIFLKSRVRTASIPRLARTAIEKFPIAVPPIEVQEEIVRILDRFSGYAASLQAELQARKEQYEYYRNLLLTFNPSACGCGTDGEREIKVTTPPLNGLEITWKPMGEIARIYSGNNKQKSSSGKFPVYGSTGIIAYCNKPTYRKQQILIARVGANAGFTHLTTSDEYDVSDNTLIVDLNGKYNLKFIFHYLVNYNPNRLAKGGGQPLVTASEIKKICIPIPPIEHQKKIVAILDRFEALVNDLTQGLPAEIAAVRERYEYYRNKLLTFKKRA